jgi:hypothetical protein
MMRLTTTLLAVLLLAAPTAIAKEVEKVTVCGAAGCVDRTDRADESVVGTGGPIDPPSTKSDWYDIRMAIGDGERVVDTFPIVYVPAQSAIRSQDEHGNPAWYTAGDAPALDRLVEGITPRPARTLDLSGVRLEEPTARVDQTFAPTPPDDGAGFPWLVLLVLVLPAGVLIYRRSRTPGTSAADGQTASAPTSAPAS